MRMGLQPRPADYGLIKTVGYDLSLMYNGVRFQPRGSFFIKGLFRYKFPKDHILLCKRAILNVL